MTRVAPVLHSLVLAALAACFTSCDKPQPDPFFEVKGATVKLWHWGGPNHSLKYLLHCRYDTAGGTIEIVRSVDGEEHTPYTMTGHGALRGNLELIGTFLNTGEPARVGDLMDSLEFEPSWRTDFVDGKPVPFLSYTGFQGQQVRYSVRLVDPPAEAAER